MSEKPTKSEVALIESFLTTKDGRVRLCSSLVHSIRRQLKAGRTKEQLQRSIHGSWKDVLSRDDYRHVVRLIENALNEA